MLILYICCSFTLFELAGCLKIEIDVIILESPLVVPEQYTSSVLFKMAEFSVTTGRDGSRTFGGKLRN